ncbi:MAG: radical SAM protein [Spirochaetaceae bacterium]
MANILLTEQCVRSCPYCFAKKHMENSENKNLQWEDFIYIVDLFEKRNPRYMSLLGGEPTLHKHFVDFVLYLINRDFGVTVFTSGIMSPSKLEALKKALAEFPKAKVSFVVNLNHPSMSDEKELERIDAFLDEFGESCTLSFNFYTLDMEMEYLFDYIERFNLNRHIRIGLAHPIPGEKNLCIPTDQFDEMVEKLATYIPMFIKYRVSPGFDCGFPLCKFTDDQLGKFKKLEKGNGSGSVKFGCNAAIDIGPDMTVWSCFPLSKYHRKSLYDFDSVDAVYEYYQTMHYNVRDKKAGVFEECEGCRYQESELCKGGCLAHIVNTDESIIKEASGVKRN